MMDDADSFNMAAIMDLRHEGLARFFERKMAWARNGRGGMAKSAQ